MWKPSLFLLYLGRFRKFYFKYRVIPVFSQCMEIIGVNSKSVVHRFFQQMVELGYLEKIQGIYYPGNKLVSLPLFESIRAGVPTEVIDEFSENISIEQYLVDNPENTVLLTVKWDSMIDAGILEWDILIVNILKEEKVWNIVIGIVDGEYTVKYFDKDEKNIYYLRPGNNNYDNIYPNEGMQIFGVVTGSFRRY